MTPFALGRRSTFLMQSGPARDPSRKHLFVVVTNRSPCMPPASGECVLCVSVSSIIEGGPYDKTCILRVGDHSFIQHPSYINYGAALISNVANIQAKENELIIKEELDERVFLRICKGLLDSKHVSQKARRFFEKANK